MISISGKHFISTRVEMGYSPKNKEGYQTYYSSKGILEEDTKALADIAGGFDLSDITEETAATAVRKQFFRLPSNKYAFINTVAVKNLEITDAKGRYCYLAHGVLLEPKQFSELLFNPFKVFDGFRFLASPLAMVKEFDQLAGREALCQFEAEPYTLIDGGDVFSKNGLSLYQIALTSTVNKQGLSLIGNNLEVESFLRALFQFAQPTMRSAFTFNTFADGSNLSSELFWAVGLTSSRGGARTNIKLPGSIPDPDIKFDNKKNLYYQWLENAVGADSKSAYSFSTTAQLLTNAFQNNEEVSEDILDIEASQSFFETHKSLVLQRLENTFSQLTSAFVAKRLISLIWQNQVDIRKILSLSASQSESFDFMSPFLRKLIVHDSPMYDGWKKNDWTNIQNFGERANDLLIMFWASTFTGDKKTRINSCKVLSENDYQQSLLLIGKSIDPADYIPTSTRNLKHLFSSIWPLLNQMDNSLFAEFVVELYNNKQYEFIDNLRSKVSSMDNKVLTHLESKLTKMPVGSSFAISMQHKRQALGRPEGIKGIFYRAKK